MSVKPFIINRVIYTLKAFITLSSCKENICRLHNSRKNGWKKYNRHLYTRYFKERESSSWQRTAGLADRGRVSPAADRSIVTLAREAAGRDIDEGHDLTFSTYTDRYLIDPHLMPISSVTLKIWSN